MMSSFLFYIMQQYLYLKLLTLRKLEIETIKWPKNGYYKDCF